MHVIMCGLMYGLLHKLYGHHQASVVAMFKAFLAARVWGIKLILGETFLVCNVLLWDQSATSQFLQKKHSKTALVVHELVSFRHVFLIESCSLGHCSIQNIQASRSQFLVSLHPPWRPSKLSALTPRVMEVGKQMATLPTIRSFTSLDHVKTEPWQWVSKGRMKLPLSKTY